MNAPLNRSARKSVRRLVYVVLPTFNRIEPVGSVSHSSIKPKLPFIIARPRFPQMYASQLLCSVRVLSSVEVICFIGLHHLNYLHFVSKYPLASL